MFDNDLPIESLSILFDWLIECVIMLIASKACNAIKFGSDLSGYRDLCFSVNTLLVLVSSSGFGMGDKKIVLCESDPTNS